MPASKYRFVSPGVQLREIDRSQIPEESELVGPVIIGRSLRGPSLRPVKVRDFTEFVEIFGEPQAGGVGGDVWREGIHGLSPTYGSYAVRAWLRNSTPCTFVRLLGKAHSAATSDGKAGWKIGSAPDSTRSTGGAYGLFLIQSGTYGGVSAGATGTLGAVFYVDTNGGTMELTGTDLDGTASQGTGVFIKSAAAGKTFTAVYTDSAGATANTFRFDFNEDSGNFIRKVFNTSPPQLNSNLFSSTSSYFLGESFERDVSERVGGGSQTGDVLGVILALSNGTTDWNINQVSTLPARTPWVIAQDNAGYSNYIPQNATKLFQIVALDTGEWTQQNLKISITDLRYSNEPSSPYGSFTVIVRKASDNDSSVKIVESFSNCNLNPSSPNYIAARIGDSRAEWDDEGRRYRYFGRFANNSRYVYVKMNSAIDTGGPTPQTLIPFGYLGPARFMGFSVTSGSSDAKNIGTTTSFSSCMAKGGDIAGRSGPTGVFADVGDNVGFSASFVFPRTYLRPDTTFGSLSDPTDAFWGLDTTKSGSSLRFDSAYADVVRGLPDDLRTDPPAAPSATSATEYSYIFSLDEVSRYADVSTSTISSYEAYYVSGSRKAGRSLSATSSTGTGSYKNTLDANFDQFTVPMYGGFDGVDIKQTEPFNNYYSGTPTQYNSAKFNSIKLAIDSCSDPEIVEYNILSAPGITTTGLTNHLIDVCERRADALGVIDIEGGFVPAPDRSTPGSDSDVTNRGSANTAANNMKGRQINNSYAACYYPWIQTRDEETGVPFFAPPSIAAIGTYSNSQAKSELWFAPAGFTRGGLTEGAGGIPIIGVTERLTSKERDKLYEVNINPIASFPAEGLVIYGQKTLQATRSALDRVNVRRLLIHLKKEVSRISSRLLFDPNVQVTWDRFTGQVRPLLDSVKQRLGLDDYKVVLDTTTTTPDLIDRNIMYAKIFLKPSRAIEFIAIDFIITNTGASFED